jgi:hypothetical protein
MVQELFDQIGENIFSEREERLLVGLTLQTQRS